MEVADRARGDNRLRINTKILSVGLSVLFALLLAVLFVRTTQVAIERPPTFDGAMNLQVASSIAKGEGYRRTYAAREAFPHEIQTGAPYILPSAAVFRIWNVGIAQAEVVNLVYLALLLAMVYLLVRPLGGRALALFAACTALMVPGVHEYGLYGYGEIPALFYVLAAAILYFRESKSRGIPAAFAAGILLALAFYTKTVMLIGIGSVCLYAGLEWLLTRDDQRRWRWKRLCAMAAGGALPVVAMEGWRAIAVGGLHAWVAWWQFETRNVFMQAGVGHAYGNFTHSLAAKFRVHFDLLSHDYRTSLLFTGIWLVLLIVAGAVTLLRPAHRRGKWATLTILTIAFVYMLWWLLVTPTAKAWHRRIIDGMICADVGLIMCVAMWFRDRGISALRRSSQVAVLVLAALGLALPLMWLAKGSHTLLAGQASRKACDWRMAAGVCAQFNPDGSVAALRRTVQEVRALPANAYVFGIGWYSAPRVGLLSERHMLDINDVPVARLQPGRPVYFVQGPDTPPAQLQRIGLLYGMTGTQNYGYALIPMDPMTPVPMTPRVAKVKRHIGAAANYPYLRGFNGSEGANGRWLSDDNLILLTPSAGDRFELVAYVLPVSRYAYPGAPRVIVSFDGCAAPPQQTTPDSLNTLVFAIPSQCAVTPGTPVNVRIEVDNLANVAITYDQRPLGVLAKSLGFVPGPHAAPHNE